MKYRGFVKQSRTIDFGLLVQVFGAVLIALPDLGLTTRQLGVANLIIGVIIIILRSKTTGAVGDK